MTGLQARALSRLRRKGPWLKPNVFCACFRGLKTPAPSTGTKSSARANLSKDWLNLYTFRKGSACQIAARTRQARPASLRAGIYTVNGLFIDLYASGIDSFLCRRYSQAQIPDLVAHTIPRFLHPAQSFGSFLPCALRFPSKSPASSQTIRGAVRLRRAPSSQLNSTEHPFGGHRNH